VRSHDAAHVVAEAVEIDGHPVGCLGDARGAFHVRLWALVCVRMRVRIEVAQQQVDGADGFKPQ
jgi:hypothetical protein